MIWLLVILLVVFIFVLIKAELNARFLVDEFSTSNTITYGTKGKGKDFLYAFIMYRRKEKNKDFTFTSNIDFGQPKENIRPISFYSVAPNTFTNLVNDRVEIIPKVFVEKQDYFISDAGIFLPSQYDSLLDKLYPSLPIVYALSRHLGLFNIHSNAQALGRIWKKIREQADAFILARGVVHFPRYSFSFLRYYDNEMSAEQKLAPYPKRLLMNKEQKAQYDLFVAQHGTIKNLFVIVDRRKVNYDSRYFHRVFYGSYSPTTQPKKEKKNSVSL